jgi:hypothetical protein
MMLVIQALLFGKQYIQKLRNLIDIKIITYILIKNILLIYKCMRVKLQVLLII